MEICNVYKGRKEDEIFAIIIIFSTWGAKKKKWNRRETTKKKIAKGSYNKIEPFVCVGSGFSKIHIFI